MVEPFWHSQFFTELNIPYDPSIPVETFIQGNLHSRKQLYMNVYSSFICNCPKLESTQMFFIWEWINILWYVHRWNTIQQLKATDY